MNAELSLSSLFLESKRTSPLSLAWTIHIQSFCPTVLKTQLFTQNAT